MKTCKVICKDGEGREVNPHLQYVFGSGALSQAWAQFEKNNKPYPAPNIPNGSHLCVLQWQQRSKRTGNWNNCDWLTLDDADHMAIDYVQTRQIWILASPEMNNQNNKGMETVEEAARFYAIKRYKGWAEHVSRDYIGTENAFESGAQWAKQQSDGEIENLKVEIERLKEALDSRKAIG